jgi:large subunit ribosomal protein L20
MTRVKRGSVARKRRKKILLITSGAIGSNSRLFRIAQQHSMKAIRYSYRGRRDRKRLYRSLWLVRLNARLQIYGWNYSSFFSYLRQKKCLLNRKILAQIIFYDPIFFQRLLDISKLIIHFIYMYLTARKKTALEKPYTINYKNISLLRHYIGFTGKILPRRVTKLNAKEHRAVAKAIRRARRVGLLPFVWLTYLFLHFK